MKGSLSARTLLQQQTVDSTNLTAWHQDPPQKQDLMDLNRSQWCQVRNKFESLQLTKRPTANHTELKFVEDWSPPETKMLPRQQKVDSIHGNPSCCLNNKSWQHRTGHPSCCLKQQKLTASISKNRYQFNGDSTVSIRPTKDPRATV